MKKFAVLLLLMVLPLSGFARFEEIVDDVNVYFKKKNGIVISSKPGEVIIDIGKKHFVYKGEVFQASRPGEKVIHPITGKVLGVKSMEIASLTVKEVFDDYSICRASNVKQEILSKDTVSRARGGAIAFQTENFSNRHELLLKGELFNSPLLTLDAKSNLVFKAIRGENGGITVALYDSDNKIISKFYADVKIDSGNQKTVDVVKSKMLDYGFLSIAVGHPFGGNDLIIAAASERELYLYRFTEKGFEQIKEIEGDFDRITNVEFHDLDGDGRSELFVSNVGGKSSNNSALSFVYGEKGGQIVLLEKGMRFLIRSIMTAGEKRLVSQKITKDGRFIGRIAYLDYVGKQYVRGEAIPGTEGKTLFGFGYGDLNEDGVMETLWINSNFKLVVSDEKEELYKSNTPFSHTSNFFFMGDFKEVQLRGGEMEELKAKDDYLGDSVEYKQFIKGRVYVFNDPKTLFVAENDPSLGALKDTYKYSSATVRSLIWNNGLKDRWQYTDLQPEIMDYEPFERQGSNYIVILRQEKGGMFSSDKSELIYMELE